LNPEGTQPINRKKMSAIPPAFAAPAALLPRFHSARLASKRLVHTAAFERAKQSRCATFAMQQPGSNPPPKDLIFDASHWYSDPAIALDFEVAAHSIPAERQKPSVSDTARTHAGYFATTEPSAFSVVEHIPFVQRQSLLELLQEESRLDDADLSTRLARGLCTVGAGPDALALVANLASPPNVLRVAWVGKCGVIVIRDCEVIWRSYTAENGMRESLEHALLSPPSSPSPGPNVLCCLSEIQSAFVELVDGDLIIAGSQSMWSSLSEQQILSFVRPVNDATGYDATLSMANSTCLGSWRVDEPNFISYMLAHLGDNFANATHARPLSVLNPFRFPDNPTSTLDDVIVIAAACSFTS
jgi:hypothetical protein